MLKLCLKSLRVRLSTLLINGGLQPQPQGISEECSDQTEVYLESRYHQNPRRNRFPIYTPMSPTPGTFLLLRKLAFYSHMATEDVACLHSLPMVAYYAIRHCFLLSPWPMEQDFVVFYFVCVFYSLRIFVVCFPSIDISGLMKT